MGYFPPGMRNVVSRQRKACWRDGSARTAGHLAIADHKPEDCRGSTRHKACRRVPILYAHAPVARGGVEEAVRRRLLEQVDASLRHSKAPWLTRNLFLLLLAGNSRRFQQLAGDPLYPALLPAPVFI